MKNSITQQIKNIFALLALLFVLSSLIGVDGNTIINAAVAQEKNSPPAIGLTMDSPLIRNAINIQNKHSKRLMNIQGVLGSGIGLNAEGQPIIKVYTMHAEIPDIPVSLDNIPVKVKVTGMIVALTDPTTYQVRPVPIGVSTGHPDITAGTIGARVKDSAGNVYALSNNHVYANSNETSVGENILQPGPYDGGTEPGDVIGTLYDFEPINFSGGNNIVDAAIAASSNIELDNSTPYDDGYGAPDSETTVVALDQQVKKYGRTTGLTYGTVDAIGVTVAVCYEQKCNPVKCQCTKVANFVDQFAVTDNDNDPNTTFSAGGDSGSLIVTEAGNIPVGLLFAGGGGTTFANQITPVLERFNVVIDNGSEVISYAPTAGFTYSPTTTTPLNITFTDTSTDPDGSVMSWSWDFGDGNTSSSQSPSYTYASSGTYTVTLTVTDDKDNEGSTSQNVTVSDGSCSFELTATGYKVKGRQKADLAWSCATSTSIDILRDGGALETVESGTDSNGQYTDEINNLGGGSYIYQVCNRDTSDCSNEAVVSF
jgi:chitodextrinase